MPLALVHEGTLVHAVSVLALWCNRFTTEVPKKLTDWFKKVFSLKTSTSAVRHAYLQCMLASFRGKMLASTGGPLSLWEGGRAGMLTTRGLLFGFTDWASLPSESFSLSAAR